jgi:hypothetical protein
MVHRQNQHDPAPPVSRGEFEDLCKQVIHLQERVEELEAHPAVSVPPLGKSHEET